MMTRRCSLAAGRRALGIGLVILAAAIAAPALADGARRPADLLPDDVFAAVTIYDGAKQVAALRESALLKSALDSEAYGTLAARPEFLQAQGGLLLFAGRVGLDPWKLIGQAAGREATLALARGEKPGKPAFYAVVQLDDAAAGDRIVNALLELAGATVDGKPVEERSRAVDGVRGYRLNPEAFIAVFDGFAAFSNEAQALEALVKARGTDAAKLSGLKSYQTALEAAPKSAIAAGFVNMAVVRRFAGEKFAPKADNPVGALLLGAIRESLHAADTAALWLAAEAQELRVGARLLGAPGDRKAFSVFSVGSGEQRDWGRLGLKDQMAALTVARDWVGLWDAREDLMLADGVRGLQEFASGLTTIMGNLDFQSELLPELGPTMRLLVARQEFADGAPQPELPAFALIAQLKAPEKLAARLENAAMMALSIINIDQGQKGRPQYQINLEQHAGAKVLVARFPAGDAAAPRSIRYNFEPSVAVVGDRLLIATSRGLLIRLIDAIGELPLLAEKSDAPAADALEIDLRQVQRILEANRDLLITNRMLEQDESRAEAGEIVGAVLDAAKRLSALSVRVQPQKDGLTLSAALKLCDGR